jgi:E3 ubiquitin-protein ligase mind-bomb
MQVNEKSSSKTCLQVAAHQGHLPLTYFLVKAGANLELADEVGDTALHYSAFGLVL